MTLLTPPPPVFRVEVPFVRADLSLIFVFVTFSANLAGSLYDTPSSRTSYQIMNSLYETPFIKFVVFRSIFVVMCNVMPHIFSQTI